jgi:hypothetical protein
MERKRVYIVVKTYPTISAKYAELVLYFALSFTSVLTAENIWIEALVNTVLTVAGK